MVARRKRIRRFRVLKPDEMIDAPDDSVFWGFSSTGFGLQSICYEQ